jgi:hypothetical protein
MARPPAIRLLGQLLTITEREGILVAIGGGLAVNVHGYRRETEDVDAFFRLEDRLRVIRALREAGFLVERLFAPNHYAAFPPRARDVRRRIDLLFPEGDPELAAVEQPELAVVEEWGLTVPVFPVELLVIAKLQVAAEPEGERHSADVRALLELGAFEPATVRALLRRFDRSLLPALDAIVASFTPQAPATPVRTRTRATPTRTRATPTRKRATPTRKRATPTRKRATPTRTATRKKKLPRKGR